MSFQINGMGDRASIYAQWASFFLDSTTILEREPSAEKIKNFKVLSDLKISGSGQFLEAQLPELLKKTQASELANILFIDLREESHGYLGDRAIFWKEQTYDREDKLLQGLANRRIAMCFSNGQAAYYRGAQIKSEKVTVEGSNAEYMRLPITDMSNPSDEEIDKFIAFALSQPTPQKWLHFHCKTGKNRTRLMMALYDILLNAKAEEFTFFIPRHRIEEQVDASNTSDKKIKAKIRSENAAFLRQFYDFCREENLHVVKWKNWKNSKLKTEINNS